MEILCTLKNLSLHLGSRTLYDNIQITLHQGDRIGLLGLNGQGKSTLFKVLKEEISPDRSTPPFAFDKSSQFTKGVFVVPQEVNGNDLKLSILEYFYSFYPELKNHKDILDRLGHLSELSSSQLKEQEQSWLEFERLEGWTLEQDFLSYLNHFSGLDPEKKLKDLSGGEQRKVLLSIGLSTAADLVLWDEPTNHLDLESIKMFEEELLQSKQTYMMITHDRYLLGKTTNKIFNLHAGKIEAFAGSYQDYLTYLSDKESQAMLLLNRLNNHLRRETAWMRQGIKARGTRSKKRVEGFHDLKGKITKIHEQARRELSFQLQNTQKKSKKFLAFKDVSFQHQGGKKIFENLTLDLFKGEKIGIVGANGVGKSTLLQLICGQLTPNLGEVKRSEGLQIQYFSQKREELIPTQTPAEYLGEKSDFIILSDQRQIHIASYFEKFLFRKEDLHRPISCLSGGEKNRLQLAKNLTKPGDLWIFDEPTNDLDLESLQVLETQLAEFPGTILLVSHDRAFLSNVTNKIWWMKTNKKNVTEFEFFEAGYEQVAPLLETSYLAKELEEEFPESADLATPTNPDQKASKGKMSNQEKLRFTQLPKEIEQTEKLIKKLEVELAAFDFSNMNKDQKQKYNQINSQFKNEEEKLLNLYAEWESISGD
jgi:ATP-binding cassette subfamily F protein uup